MTTRTLFCAIVLFGMLAHYKPLPHVDFYPTYVAARLANEGQWRHIYHPSIWLHGNVDPLWDARASQLVRLPLQATSFVYHPWYLTLARSIAAHVTYEEFQQIWVWLSKVSMVFAGLSMALLLRWQSLERQLVLTLLVGLSPTTLYGVDLGQNVLPAFVFSLLAAAAWQSGASLLVGGLLVALAWTFKPWCVMLLPLCWLLRGARAGALTTVALVAVMVVLPEVIMPRELMQDYGAMNLALTKMSTLAWNNLSVLSLVERFTTPDWSQKLGLFGAQSAPLAHRAFALGAVAIVLLVGAMFWRWRRPAARSTSAAWLALMLMPVGTCWIHYFILALPVACVTAFSKRMPWPVRASGATLLALVPSLEAVYGLSQAEYLAYQAHPAGLPWLLALPMALVACASLSALWYGQSAEGKPRPPYARDAGSSEGNGLRSE